MVSRDAQMKYIYISKKFGQRPPNLILDFFLIQTKPNCKTILGRKSSPASLPQNHLHQNKSPPTPSHCQRPRHLFTSLLSSKIYHTWRTLSSPNSSSSPMQAPPQIPQLCGALPSIWEGKCWSPCTSILRHQVPHSPHGPEAGILSLLVITHLCED